MPDEFVHVRIKDTGAKGSIRVGRYDPAIYEKTGEDPLDNHGEPRPWKSKTTVDKSAAAKKATSGQQAESKKENS